MDFWEWNQANQQANRQQRMVRIKNVPIKSVSPVGEYQVIYHGLGRVPTHVYFETSRGTGGNQGSRISNPVGRDSERLYINTAGNRTLDIVVIG